MSFLAPIAGAVVGGLMSDGGGGQQTATKDPWAPADPYLREMLSTGGDLNRHYQQNPFNPIQQTAYQNMLGDVDAFRTQMAPGLMQFANGMMGSNYQRGPRQSQMEAMQQPAGGLLAQSQQTKPMQMSAPQGLLSTGNRGPFQVPQGQGYGLLDFTQLNPFTAENGIPRTPANEPTPEKTPEQLAQEEWDRLVRSGMGYQGAGA